MEPNAAQHRLLRQIAQHTGPVRLNALKPATKREDRDALVAAKLVDPGKNGKSVTLALTDAGRRHLAEHPDPPGKVKPAKAPKPPKPPKALPTFPFPDQRVFLLKLAFARPGEPVEGLSTALKAA